MQIAHPTKCQQQQGDHVMQEHLPEILSLNVKKLSDCQRPVKRHRNHIVPPDVIFHRLRKIKKKNARCYLYRSMCIAQFSHIT